MNNQFRRLHYVLKSRRVVSRYPTALAMVASGAVDLKPLVTHRLTLEESVKAFEISRTGAGGAIKVMIGCSAAQSS